MTDWSNKISSATVEPRDYGMGVVISYWSGIVTSGSVEEATAKHGWPLKIEPFDKSRLFREFNKLESKVEEMQKVIDTAVMFLQGNELFIKAEQIKVMSQALKGESQ